MTVVALAFSALLVGSAPPEAYFVRFTPPEGWQPVAASDVAGAEKVDVLGAWRHPKTGAMLVVIGSKMQVAFQAQQFAFAAGLDISGIEGVKAEDATEVEVDGRPGYRVVLCGPGDGRWVRTRSMSMIKGRIPTVEIQTTIINRCQPEGSGCDLIQVLGGAKKRYRSFLSEAYERLLASIRFTGHPADRVPGRPAEPAREPRAASASGGSEVGEPPGEAACPPAGQGMAREAAAVLGAVVQEATSTGDMAPAVALVERETGRPFLVEACPVKQSQGEIVWQVSPVAKGRTRFVVLLDESGRPAYVVAVEKQRKWPLVLRAAGGQAPAVPEGSGVRIAPCDEGVLAAIRKLLATGG